MLYVLEGATQGGRVISPRVARLLSECQLPRNKLPQNKLPQDEWALGGSDGVQYLQLFRHGEWARLQRVIACVSRRSHSADDVVKAAIETFRSLGGYLDFYLIRQSH
ncbi:hypothetical protein [uncultured Porticoccus sp.]|uniref:hypothetical protein n=1 Tax=uncultured Porticoccus sp. TaxID=1256050 RepID=UPI002613AAB5|nr:hypothetical protein [uncultured Porticoccus sp.]